MWYDRGVSAADIEADHGLTAKRLHAQTSRKIAPHDENAAVQQVLDRAKRSRREAILAALALDIEARLRAGGLTRAELDAARSRLLAR
jgi:hypothetical protein